MKFIESNYYQTGIAVHLTSIPGKDSCGCGEFEDLIEFAKWCEKTGLSIIQILPVHDTDENPSPYSAVNAFALNPVYIRLDLVTGCESFQSEIKEFKKKYSNLTRIPYLEIHRFKTSILQDIFNSRRDILMSDPALIKWIEENEWIKYYAGYKILSRINFTPVWRNWKTDPVFQSGDIHENLENLLKSNKNDYMFFCFVQFELEKQLKKASRELTRLNINLKGDMPVLMDRESSDVWFHRNLFKTEFSAGAPPDQFSEKGQNWGFPVYNIEKLHETNFHWWKERIRHLDSFFHALRLDHVIGYMRIWQVNSDNDNAGSGYFSPAEFFNVESFREYGFTPEEVSCLATPMIAPEKLQGVLAREDLEKTIKKYLVKMENGYYKLSDELSSEKLIERLPERPFTIQLLKSIFLNRSLIIVKPGFYSPKWYFDQCDFFQALPHEKKDCFRRFVHDYYSRSENIWQANGTTFLSAIKDASTFLLCGEDLGAVPKVTAELLEKLNIMSLKVLRWTRKYGEPGAPFIEPAQYPPKSVATTSVHDSDNIRQWWKDDTDARNLIYPLLKNENNSGENQLQNNDILNEKTAIHLLQWFFGCSSRLVISPMQDFFSTYPRFRVEKPEEERINVPGKILDSNWNYKIPVSLEQLTSDQDFQKIISSLVSERSARKPPSTRLPGQD